MSGIELVIVSHSLAGGGAERFASTLANHLDRAELSPTLVTAVDRIVYPVPEDVAVHSLGYGGVLHLPGTIRRLARRLEALAPRVVLSNVLSTNCLVGAALGRLERPPAWVARVGNAPSLSEPRLQAWWSKRVYPRASRLVANAKAMVGELESRHPALAGRVVDLPNPTDFERLDALSTEQDSRRGEGVAQLLWVGRLVPQKRPDVLLDALAEVRRRRDVRLWLCGEGPFEEGVRAQIERLGLGDAVEMLGFVENPFALMKKADVFVLTSDYEGLPNALLEAQGLGLPAVATRCPYGPEEIIADGETGWLVPVGDAGAVAAAVEDLISDAEARRRMGGQAAVRARSRYGLDRALPAWQRLLVDVAREAR